MAGRWWSALVVCCVACSDKASAGGNATDSCTAFLCANDPKAASDDCRAGVSAATCSQDARRYYDCLTTNRSCKSDGTADNDAMQRACTDPWFVWLKCQQTGG